MQGYATIQEASKLTGKHKDTIRRLAKQNQSSNNVVKGKNGYLINKEWLLSHYDLTSVTTTSPEAPGATFDSEDEQEATAEVKTMEQTASVTDSLIKALTNELEAKNLIIKQQQDTIQQIVDQQQQLTARLMELGSGNSQKLVEKGGKLTPVNPIEEIVIEENVIKGIVIKDKVRQKENKKRHWWNKK